VESEQTWWELEPGAPFDPRWQTEGPRPLGYLPQTVAGFLALAYAGASMPLLVLFVLTEQPLGIVANSEAVSTEILRTLVGSIGLVARVPITTWLAVRLAPSPEPAGSG
jgi:hypothetical protein